jgi:hypothetical protein
LAACLLACTTAKAFAQGQPTLSPSPALTAQSSPAAHQAILDIPWPLVISIVTGVAAVLAILEIGYKIGRSQVPGTPTYFFSALLRRRRLSPDEQTATTRRASIDALRELLESTRKRLALEQFPGVKKAGDQLWKIHMELERLEWWLDLYVSKDDDHSGLLEKIEKSIPMEIDLVFLRYVSAADAIFGEEIRGRCEQMLRARDSGTRK